MIKKLFTVVVLLCTTTITLTAQDYNPDWYKKKANYFKAVSKTTDNNFTMTVMGTIDEERCDSAYEIGVFCGDECRLSLPFYSNANYFSKYFYFSKLTIGGEKGEVLSFRFYDHRNNVEVAAEVCPVEISFIADAVYGSFNDGLYDLAFEKSTTHRSALDIDDETELPFAGKQYGISADGIACTYTRNAYLDGGYETIVLPFDADITAIKAAGFVFEKFEGFGDNTIKFVELASDENLKAGVAYLFRYTGTPSDGREELVFTADVQQLNDGIVSEEGWTGTFKAMSGEEIAGKYILNLKGDMMQKAGSGASLAPYHAFLSLPSNVNVAKLSVAHSQGSTTAIDVLQQNDDAAVVYDLNGRVINDLPTNGIIIKNQKKIYIK